ncbi:hypothetical protein DFH94DRAFT_848745 [Russula ochroleuca]|uniref:Uncharacterized protein n=1 Tax=Russula ochroleuca TaxID=152965 RepID=A0A9P5JV74_9AGAM|nr:hypothetical protein DFH94DRAFT_848745 [Russula ochroleuca]
MWGLMSARCEAEEPACRHSRARGRHVIETDDRAMKALIRPGYSVAHDCFYRSACTKRVARSAATTVAKQLTPGTVGRMDQIWIDRYGHVYGLSKVGNKSDHRFMWCGASRPERRQERRAAEFPNRVLRKKPLIAENPEDLSQNQKIRNFRLSDRQEGSNSWEVRLKPPVRRSRGREPFTTHAPAARDEVVHRNAPIPPITASEDHSVKFSPARSCLAARYGLGCHDRFRLCSAGHAWTGVHTAFPTPISNATTLLLPSISLKAEERPSMTASLQPRWSFIELLFLRHEWEEQSRRAENPEVRRGFSVEAQLDLEDDLPTLSQGWRIKWAWSNAPGQKEWRDATAAVGNP